MLRAFFLGMALATTTALSAQADTLKCDIKTYGAGGWTPKEMYIDLDTSTRYANVLDPMIYHAHKKPIRVPAKKRKNGDYRFEWVLTLPSNITKGAVVRYRTDLNPTTGKGKIKTTVVMNDIQNNGGRLTCAPHKGS